MLTSVMMEAKATAPFTSDRSNLPQPSASKGSYSKVGFSYDGNGKEETHISEDDDGEDFNSDDSNNEGMEIIAKEYGVKRSRSRSRSYSPSYSRRYSRIIHFDDIHRSKPRTPKIEYITEFGSSGEADEPRLEGFSPPRSPTSQVDMLNRSEHWTFNSCQDRLDSLFSVQHISHIVV
ncbi:uncharacterized protein LOC106779150 isoform X2 [Vigna radiata var. radiata]|uniref:Uncharacterized protein LOC106779150 isoform X2 n=1 Tax=Vigna radiata var. radiata TaxID=3916 RepID=A0A3Q0EP51_VIGRR|nr:uncharacterized protein LOC106779150 isoform X2 [Vigna radiata var. radiata]